MQVLKFGGTSVANATNIAKVTDIVSKAAEIDRTVLVCSAISKCTDTLIDIGKKAAARDSAYTKLIDALQEKHRDIISNLLPKESQESALKDCDEQFESLRSISLGVFLLGELSPASLDAIQGMGELLSTRIIARNFLSKGIQCKWIDSREIILTEEVNGKNVVVTETTNKRINEAIAQNPTVGLFILPGFIASDSKGRTTTLGRGGSDYTAALYAVALGARRLEIWTDVSGIKTANPKDVPGARTISHISYRAALELSHFGAKVIYPPTIQPVVKEGIPIYVKNTFEPEAEGTVIEKNPPLSGEGIIGISNSDDIALLSLEGSGMVGIPGFSSRLFDTLSREDINIILITQASSVHTMCIAVSAKDAEKARKAADKCFAYEISLGRLNPLKVEKGFSIVCLVGDDVIGHSGATGRMLAALGRNGIPVRATAQGSSERNISVIVPSDRVNEAICQIHSEFFDKDKEKVVNLFIAGYGNVAHALLDIIAKNSDRIAHRTGKRLRVCGIANSRKYVIDTLGIGIAATGTATGTGNNAGAAVGAIAGAGIASGISGAGATGAVAEAGLQAIVSGAVSASGIGTAVPASGVSGAGATGAVGGADFAKIDALLKDGKDAADNAYFSELAGLSVKYSVFVDCSASQAVTLQYKGLFKAGYSVVACNKIAFASAYGNYAELKRCANDNGVKLRYETTVGAALPIIETIDRCYNCGDDIKEVRAILSGTLNYIFSSYCPTGNDGCSAKTDSCSRSVETNDEDLAAGQNFPNTANAGSGSFAEVVREAMKAGYTEPDPRLDLSGTDVLRKILIIARENGITLEESDVQIRPLLGPEYFEGSVEDFLALLEKNEDSFRKLFAAAAANGRRLRYIATLKHQDLTGTCNNAYDSVGSLSNTAANGSSDAQSGQTEAASIQSDNLGNMRTSAGNNEGLAKNSITSGGKAGWTASIGLEEVEATDPLFALCGTDNAAIIRTELYPSPLVVQGRGAGAAQTASGILNDILL